MDRNKKIIKISFLGIGVNILLVLFKMIVGLIANSIAIILDAINNLSDALSSIITIIGTKLSSKRPDKEHPYGHGRIEYFASIIIAIIVFLAGAVSLKESVSKIISPSVTNYSIFTVIIVIASIVTKYFFGRYVKGEGEKLNSSSLVASGVDAIGDSFVSLSTLIGIIISFLFNINVEGYIGTLISVVILKASIEILKSTVDDMIGVRADKELTTKLRKIINKDKDVIGVYDIIVHNYGPNKMIASAHIEVNYKLTADDIHRITRRIAFNVYDELGIFITIGIYASNDTGESKEIKKYLLKILKEYKYFLEMHAFYVDFKYMNISFDLIFSFDEENPNEKVLEIKNKMIEKYPEYEYNIILDTDISD